MATPAQAAAATVGAGSLAAAGAYGITQAVKGNEGEETNTEESSDLPQDNTIPTAVTFSETDLSNYTNKFIGLTKKENLQYLVKATDENDNWWDWAFKNKYSNKKGLTLEATFNELSDSKALKKACNTAYEKEKSQYLFGDSDYLLSNISAFCTKSTKVKDISEPQPTVFLSDFSETTTYPDGVLSVATNKPKLVKKESDNTNNNDLWWGWAFKYLWTKEAQKTATTTFQGLTVGYRSTQDGDSQKALNNACDEAYKKTYVDLTATTENKSLFNDIKRFCVSDRSENNLTLPQYKEPTTTDLVKNDTNTYTSNFAKDSTNKEKLVDGNKAEAWWKWSYTTRFLKHTNKQNIPEIFRSVVKPFDASTSDPANQKTSLSQACKESYSQNKAKLEETTNQRKLASFIKDFCALGNTTNELTIPENS